MKLMLNASFHFNKVCLVCPGKKAMKCLTDWSVTADGEELQGPHVGQGTGSSQGLQHQTARR